MKTCYLFPPTPPCFILGGRYGDIVEMLPCFHEIYRRTGQKPIVISSSEYVSVYDGVSYVVPHAFAENWWRMIPNAQRYAHAEFGGGIVPQFWFAEPEKGDEIGYKGATVATLQCHGVAYTCDISLDPDYGTAMARRCGFTREEWVKLPLVFDRRSAVREAQLVSGHIGGERRPVLLYNFTGNSSPFPFTPEVVNALMRHFNRHFRMIDLGPIRATRIYDLLGFYDRAVGILTSDTVTAHLAVASPIPAIWFTVGGWTTSVPRGNCVFHCNYGEVLGNLDKVLSVVEGWKG